MPDLIIVALSFIAPIPTIVILASFVIFEISCMEASFLMASAISWEDAIKGEGIKYSLALNILDCAFGK